MKKKILNNIKKWITFLKKNSQSFIVLIIPIIFALLFFLPIIRKHSDTSLIITLIVTLATEIVAGVLTIIIHHIKYDSNETFFKDMKETMIKNNEDRTKLILSQAALLHDIGHAESAINIARANPKHEKNKSDNETKDDKDSKKKYTINEVLYKQKSQNNILELMFKNLGEIRAYFSISKAHANLSFSLAVINCIIGIILLCLAVYFSLSRPKLQPAIITAIAGAISEVFAATTLVIHKKSLVQLNHYYNALHDNEMFLSTVNLVGNISIEKQDDIYIEIIRNELMVRQEKAKQNSIDNTKKTQ